MPSKKLIKPFVAEPENCPICNRPQRVLNGYGDRVLTYRCCHFWERLVGLKFDDDPDKSSKLRHDFLRRFHAELCSVCKLVLDECRKRKMKKAIELVIPKGAQGRIGSENELVKKEVEAMECWR